MEKKLTLTEDEIYELQVTQQADQLDAWARDNRETLVSVFLDGENVPDDEYSDCLTNAVSWGMSQLLEDRHNEFFDKDIEGEEERKVIKDSDWKRVALFMMGMFADDMIETLNGINEGEEVDDEFKTNIAFTCILAALADLNDKDKNKE